MSQYPVKSKDEWRDLLCRNASGRNPGIDVGPDSYPWTIFSSLGEALAIQSSNALATANSVALRDMSEEQVRTTYEARLPQQKQSYSLGSVVMACAGFGTTIQAGDELTDPDTKARFVVVLNDERTLFMSGNHVNVRAVTAGKTGNVEPGKQLVWSQLRPGCYSTAEVADSGDGQGIAGGRDAESLDEWKSRISDMKANPAAHGNEQDIIALIEDTSGRTLSSGEVTPGHGVPVSKGFCYPALLGTGTCGIAFLIKQDDWWRSRCPTSAQTTAVFKYVASYLPKDFSLFPVVLLDVPLSVDVRVQVNAPGAAWPAYAARGAGRKVIVSAWDATNFTVGTDDGDYTGEAAPSVGQELGVFDSTTGSFLRKKIKTVTGTGPWNIVVNTEAAYSDTSYVPIVGRAVSPWHDSLPEIAAAVGANVAKTGPGECVEYPPGDGLRKMRVPLQSTNIYPHSISSRVAFDVVDSVPSVTGATFLSYSPAPVVEGADVADVYLLTDLGVYR